MKYLITTVAAAVLATAFAISADAAGTKKQTSGMSSNASASKAATCKAEAKKKYSAVHMLKRRSFEKKCMGTA